MYLVIHLKDSFFRAIGNIYVCTIDTWQKAQPLQFILLLYEGQSPFHYVFIKFMTYSSVQYLWHTWRNKFVWVFKGLKLLIFQTFNCSYLYIDNWIEQKISNHNAIFNCLFSQNLPISNVLHSNHTETL